MLNKAVIGKLVAVVEDVKVELIYYSHLLLIPLLC
jgi:hypothetical protein